jgi:hypothetical protein
MEAHFAAKEGTMTRRLVCLATTVAAAVTMLVGTAAADPVNNPHTFAIPLTCANGFTGTVYPTGAAGHAAGSTSVGVLLAQTGPDAFSTPGFELSDLTACTAASFPGVTFYVLITPRGG